MADLLGQTGTSTTPDIDAHVLPHCKVELVHALGAIVLPPATQASGQLSLRTNADQLRAALVCRR